MAEIKSTMDLVMERMAKMTANAKPIANDEDQQKLGMRLAADYLNSQLPDLIEELTKQPQESQKAAYTGAVQTLLRNITLPRDEIIQERSEAALSGILAVGKVLNVSAITQVCGELQQILLQYNKHKEQITQQVEGALKSQLEQQYSGRGVDPAQIRASMHPKYQEEMVRVQQDLNNQYNQAMDQRKELIQQQLGLL